MAALIRSSCRFAMASEAKLVLLGAVAGVGDRIRGDPWDIDPLNKVPV